MVGNAGLHRWGNTQGLMDANEIIVAEEKGQHVLVILDLLGKGVRQPGKATVAHAETQVGSLY